MTGDRRHFLRTLGVVATGGVAGCNTGRTDTPAERPEDDIPTGTATRTPTGTPTVSPTPLDTPTADWRLPPQTTKVVADDGDSRDRFGAAVVLSGDGSTALVGAGSDEDPTGSETGSAYVFERSGGNWVRASKLVPEDGETADLFGDSVALSGDGSTALLGGHAERPSTILFPGSVYVYERDGSAWTRESTLTAEDGDLGDRFGDSVAIADDGSTAVVGATGGGQHSEGGGSAYVFERGGSAWTRREKIRADDGDDGDRFGWSVAIADDGSTAVVGAIGEDQHGEGAGAAYVFEREGGSWTQREKILADDGDDGDRFGWSVAVSGDGSTAVVGAYLDENSHGEDTGAAYVYGRDGGNWTGQAKLTAADATPDAYLGESVALSDNGALAFVGAPNDQNPDGEKPGATLVYARENGSWSQWTRLSPESTTTGDRFGGSVSASGDGSAVLVGASNDDDPSGTAAGSAYVCRQ